MAATLGGFLFVEGAWALGSLVARAVSGSEVGANEVWAGFGSEGNLNWWRLLLLPAIWCGAILGDEVVDQLHE